jgi:Ni,Fe-hydrogenase III large subunit
MGTIAHQEPVRVILFIECERIAFFERELFFCRGLVLVLSDNRRYFWVLFSVKGKKGT